MCHEDVSLHEHKVAEDLAVVLDPLEENILKIEVIEDLRSFNRQLISSAVLHAAY